MSDKTQTSRNLKKTGPIKTRSMEMIETPAWCYHPIRFNSPHCWTFSGWRTTFKRDHRSCLALLLVHPCCSHPIACCLPSPTLQLQPQECCARGRAFCCSRETGRNSQRGTLSKVVGRTIFSLHRSSGSKAAAPTNIL